jgi:hypothetical protein
MHLIGFRYAVGEEALGYVERWAREGDLICLTLNNDVPIVLWRDEEGYRFVCETLFPHQSWLGRMDEDRSDKSGSHQSLSDSDSSYSRPRRSRRTQALSRWRTVVIR